MSELELDLFLVGITLGMAWSFFLLDAKGKLTRGK